MKQFWILAWEILEVALTAIVTVLIIRSFIVQPFLVSGASMEPNFEDGNYLIIDEVTYRFRDPYRGEAVVFRYPGDRRTFFIKRIVGLPGERVLIEKNAVTIFNKNNPSGFILTEDYLESGEVTSGRINVTLGSSEYFVLGDNRLHSFDSRGWGSLLRGDIIGMVRLRLWPLNGVAVY